MTLLLRHVPVGKSPIGLQMLPDLFIDQFSKNVMSTGKYEQDLAKWHHDHMMPFSQILFIFSRRHDIFGKLINKQVG